MRGMYTVWCVGWLVLLFLLLFPFIVVLCQRESWKPLAHQTVRLWAKLFFGVIGLSIRVNGSFRPEPGQAYVYCANHFSYLDIAVMMWLTPGYFAFVGKHDVKRIPLLGYVFAKLYIQVDREALRSRAASLVKSRQALAAGRSIVIFPEGGIQASEFPEMAPFKDGAFTIAIRQQVPIVPVTLVNNYLLLPDALPIHMHRLPVEVVVHEPIPTTGLTLPDLARLREETFRVIDSALPRRVESPKMA